MNNNIKETTSLVFVKGKNLFNKNNVLNGYRFGSDGALYAESGFFATDFIEVNSNTQYTVSWAIQTTQCVCYYDENKNFISRNSSNQTFITPANCKYIRASVFNGVINSAQIEQGSSATSYKPYVEKEILVKNDNGVFEKFYSEDNLNHENYSLGEQKIGTWIGGETLYRKTVQVTNTSFVAGNNNIPHNIDNLKLCVKVEAVKNGTQILPYMNLTSDNKINTATFVTGVDSTNIILRIANDSWGTSNTWYFTLYYTKITD